MATNNIAAIVVLYNPEDNIINNIVSYANNVSHLIVVDNSTQHNNTLIHNISNQFSNTIYINNNDNLGIATALNIGCDKAIELGCDWALTMDQDSKFINFENYLSCLSQQKNTDIVALLAANTMWITKDHKMVGNSICQYEERFLVITSGNLLNLSLFKVIGKFEDKLFIDMVDHDYCIKAQSKNYKILFFHNIILQHSLGSLHKRKNLITGKVRNKVEHSPQRVYYITRNYLYLWRKYHKLFPKEFHLVKTLNILFVHEITKIILYEDQKMAKIKAKFIGLAHFIFHKLGKHTI